MTYSLESLPDEFSLLDDDELSESALADFFKLLSGVFLADGVRFLPLRLFLDGDDIVFWAF